MSGNEGVRAMADQIGRGTTGLFRADDLDTTYEDFKPKGVKSLNPPTRQPWGRQAIFEDLYGNRYALMGA